MRRILVCLVCVAALCGASRLQRGGDVGDGAAAAPSPLAEMTVAVLGGFRGIVAEVVWFRTDRLQDEGRYAELAQLATWLTYLEPHTPEVWAYSAWNLAYNISVMMPSAEDRWRWVNAGLKLLRDDGLRLNPRDPVIHRELAWLFLAKIGGDMDSAATFYRSQWKKIVSEARSSGRWDALRLDPAEMAATDAEYGKLDWDDPFASALYFARAGLALARSPVDRIELRQIVYQALMLLSRNNPAFVPRTLQEMETAYRENPHPQLAQVIKMFRSRFVKAPEPPVGPLRQ